MIYCWCWIHWHKQTQDLINKKDTVFIIAFYQSLHGKSSRSVGGSVSMAVEKKKKEKKQFIPKKDRPLFYVWTVPPAGPKRVSENMSRNEGV